MKDYYLKIITISIKTFNNDKGRSLFEMLNWIRKI